MDPGRPIEKSKQDVFERSAFAEHLASFLILAKDEPSIVVGIEGKWGEGKTSCINLTKEILQKNSPRPIIVEYQPWLISTLDSVIEGFFVELAAALGAQSTSKNARSAAKKVLQFGKMLAPIKLIPGVEPWGTIVESVLSSVGEATKASADLANLSLQGRKKDLQKSLKRINRPLVVIIDDVDRLPPEHVRIVFQMLKAVCDFDRVSYFVAYDPLPVKKALSYDGVYDGGGYLEKIVQVSYRLPRLSFVHMKDYLKMSIKRVTDQCSIELSITEANLFEVLFNRTDIVRSLETPRDVNRLCNRLRLSAPNTRNEVCFADLIAFETLELKFPELSKLIRTEPDRFVDIAWQDEEFASADLLGAYDTAFTQNTEKKKDQTPLKALFTSVDYSERKGDAVQSILLFMFPKLAEELFVERDIPKAINRVTNRDALLQLLHCGPTSFTYSSEQAQRFSANHEERQQILAQYRNVNDFLGWISYLNQFFISSEVEFEDPENLCSLLLEEAKNFDPQPASHRLPRELGKFLYEVIKTQKDQLVGYNMLTKLVSSDKFLALSESTLLYFLNEYGIWQGGKYEPNKGIAKTVRVSNSPDLFSYDQLYSAKDLWLSSVREAAVTQNLLEEQKNIIGVLFRWGQLNNNDYTEPQTYVIQHSTDQQWLKKFLFLFNPDSADRELLPLIPDDKFIDFLDLTSSLAEIDNHASTIRDFLSQVFEARQKRKGKSDKKK